MSYGYNGEPESIVIKQPTGPTANATVTLFDSYSMFGQGQLRQMNGSMLEITFNSLDQDSAANGLKTYTWNDATNGYVQNLMRGDDAAFTASMPVTVTATNAPITYRWPVTGFREFKVAFTAGNTAPTATTGWQVTIVLYTNSAAVQR